jgi:hypothetical protein
MKSLLRVCVCVAQDETYYGEQQQALDDSTEVYHERMRERQETKQVGEVELI